MSAKSTLLVDEFIPSPPLRSSFGQEIGIARPDEDAFLHRLKCVHKQSVAVAGGLVIGERPSWEEGDRMCSVSLTQLPRVNIGCGSTPTPGWLNFDNSFTVRVARWPRPLSAIVEMFLDPQRKNFATTARHFDIRWADAVRRIPLADNSVEAVYTSHMLEHLDREEAQMCLREVKRVLAPGGLLRIVVPDLRLLNECYMQCGDGDAFVSSSLLAVPKPKTLGARLAFAVFGGRHHHWMYDTSSLSRLLCEAGFVDIVRLEPGITRLLSPGALDLTERAQGSICLEALKPK